MAGRWSEEGGNGMYGEFSLMYKNAETKNPPSYDVNRLRCASQGVGGDEGSEVTFGNAVCNRAHASHVPRIWGVRYAPKCAAAPLSSANARQAVYLM